MAGHLFSIAHARVSRTGGGGVWWLGAQRGAKELAEEKWLDKAVAIKNNVKVIANYHTNLFQNKAMCNSHDKFVTQQNNL